MGATHRSPCAGDASMREKRDRKLGRRRLLAASVLILGVAVASTVGACADSDEFDFKPRGTRTPVSQGG